MPDDLLPVNVGIIRSGSRGEDRLRRARSHPKDNTQYYEGRLKGRCCSCLQADPNDRGLDLQAPICMPSTARGIRRR